MMREEIYKKGFVVNLFIRRELLFLGEQDGTLSISQFGSGKVY